MGQLYGFARVNGKIVLAGTMTFALAQEASGEEPAQKPRTA
jgi:hypothetical protein